MVIRKHLRRFFIWISWLPPIGWLALNYYVEQTNHWGAFAAAPFYFIVIYSSFLISGGAGILLVWSIFQSRWDPALAIAALLSGSVVVYASTH